jgi:ABC-2 type transport system permease protein
MYAFHIRQYFKNSYFIWLVIISTLSLLMLKYLGAYSQGHFLSEKDVIISGVFGMWSSAVTSAGILHFQRGQGVLVYLINSPTSSLINLLALISAPATFGLLAYPLAYLAAGFLNTFHFVNFDIQSLLYILFLWISSLSITYLIAELFLLTKNAFVYEELLVTPVMILSGLFSINFASEDIMRVLGHLVPITYPVQLLTGNPHFSVVSFLSWLFILIVWFAAGCFIFRYLLIKIRIKGDVETM